MDDGTLGREVLGDPEPDAASRAYEVLELRALGQQDETFLQQYKTLREGDGIKQFMYWDDVPGGFVVTGDDHIYSIIGENEEDAIATLEFLEEAQRVEREVHFCFGKELVRERATCVEMIGWAFGSAYDLLSRTKDKPPDERALLRSPDAPLFQRQRNQLEYARQYFERIAQRDAQLHYFRGVILGTAAIIGAGALSTLIVWILSSFFDVEASPIAPIAAATLGGALGALVSVMTRMSSATFGELTLDISAGRTQLRRLGMFRPLIGAILGAAITSLAVSGLLPLATPEDTGRQLYFFAGLAFLAGFSERWAQDMLSVTADGLSRSSRGTDGEGRSAAR